MKNKLIDDVGLILLGASIAALVIFLAFFFSSPARAATIEAQRSLVPIDDVRVTLATLTNYNQPDPGPIQFYQGLHLGYAEDLESKQDFAFAGADLYARIQGGKLWARWGLGISVFDRQTDELSTPWDFHLSLVSGWDFGPWDFLMGIHHWSNGKGGADHIGIGNSWPANGGADAFMLGAALKF
ncbi:MAG: hypothetical protein ACE5EY_11815 [Anaerolineae bacterium]